MLEFERHLMRVARRCSLTTKVLGYVGGHPLWLITPPTLLNSNANVLIAGVFHGEEPAGGLGILEFLESAPLELFARVNLSFLPLVNPTGYYAGTRYNYKGENPNSGYGSGGTSQEGKILLTHFEHIKELGRNCFVSLHEDSDFSDFYLFTFESQSMPGPFTQMLVDAGKRFFNLTPLTQIEDHAVTNGIVFNEPDGSFEHYLSSKGVPLTACTETPGMLDLELRVRANCALVRAVGEFFAKESTEP